MLGQKVADRVLEDLALAVELGAFDMQNWYARGAPEVLGELLISGRGGDHLLGLSDVALRR